MRPCAWRPDPPTARTGRRGRRPAPPAARTASEESWRIREEGGEGPSAGPRSRRELVHSAGSRLGGRCSRPPVPPQQQSSPQQSPPSQHVGSARGIENLPSSTNIDVDDTLMTTDEQDAARPTADLLRSRVADDR